MKKVFVLFISIFLVTGLYAKGGRKFVHVEGTDLIQPNGQKLFVLGTNLGNWLNPEGYMFGFSRTNSFWMIDLMLKEMVGPDDADKFWQEFKENYITDRDIQFIASTGANTIRLPFNYKLFTDEDYMGLYSHQDGFKIIDKLVDWCRKNNLYLILDMHDCPGGQTGDNIDNGYGYPWLFDNEANQLQFYKIWKEIARYYKDEPVILGYELMNEPIAPYFANKDEMNAKLEMLYKKAVTEIRTVDRNHIILLGGSQWNGNFEPFTDWTFDKNIMYTCHRYGGSYEKEAFLNIINFRDKTQLPMYMGEIGHNTNPWQEKVCIMLRNNNIGYTFWPYKKVGSECFNAVVRPAEWDTIVNFSEANRSTFDQIRKARPDQKQALRILKQYLNNIKCENCVQQTDYIKSMKMK